VKLRITALLIVMLAVAVVAGGCVWGQRSKLGILAGARADALKNETVSFTLEASVEGLDDDSLIEDFSFKAHGATDSGNKKAVFVAEMSGFELEIRTVDGKTYTRFFGDTWTESDASDEDLDLFSGGFDPFDMLDEIGVDDSRVKHLGSGELHGKRAERFSITLTAEDLAEDALFSDIPGSGDFTVEVWIDSDGMPARLAFRFEIDPDEMGIENSKPVTYTMTLDLFDYGKPVNVEAPPADKITETPSLGSLGSLGASRDPFEGADCYGDRLDGCLQPDPKTDAMASKPDLCQGPTGRVCLVPVGKVRPDVVKAIVDFHRETRAIEVVVLPGIPLPMADLREEDSQVTAEGLFRAMKATYGASDSSASTFIAITGIDVVPESDEFGWEFGYRTGSGPFGNLHGAFSYFRMVNVAPYSGAPITDDLIHQRVAKYAARYTAILFLHSGTTDDRSFLNYREMYGFSDLDSMGTKWPELTAKGCTSGHETICIIPDGKYADPNFLLDVKAALDRLANAGLPVEIFEPVDVYFFPSQPDWGVEFQSDLSTYYVNWTATNAGISVIGISDNAFANEASAPARFDYYPGASQVGVVSAFDSSLVGSQLRQDRIYQMVLRSLLQVHYHLPLSDDPNSLLWKGATKPSDLDGKTAPPIPR
jgi:hypothetical protein